MKDARIKWLKTPPHRIIGRRLNLLSLVGGYYITTTGGLIGRNDALIPNNCFVPNGKIFETRVYRVNTETFNRSLDDWVLLNIYSKSEDDVRNVAQRHIDICRRIANGVYCFDNSTKRKT